MQTQTTVGAPAEHHLSVRSSPAGLVAHGRGSAAYDALVTGFNLDLAVSPVAVVEPTDAEDVVTVVRLGGEHGFGVGVRLTGHGLAPDLDDQVMVHTGRLSTLQVDAEGRRARVGAGVVWQQVLDAAAPHGLGAVAGSAPAVGVVGYLTGGGLSPVGRTYGLAIDHVRSFDVVTGDGVLQRASVDENTDLFWALKGGRGTAGIVTAVEIDLVPVAELYAGSVFFDGTDAGAVLRTWVAWSADLPAEATTSIAFLRLPPLPHLPPPLAGRFTVSVRFAWTGEPERGPEVLAPVRAAATPVLDGVGPLPFAALGAIHARPDRPDARRRVVRRAGRAARRPRSRPCWRPVGPDADCPQIVVEVRQLGGAMRTGADAAYAHRDAGFSLHTVGLGVPPVRDAALAPRRGAGGGAWGRGARAGCCRTSAPAPTPPGTGRPTARPASPGCVEVVLAHDPQNVLAGGRALRAVTG